MIKTKLILVDGISGSGKSTTAHFIARQLNKNGIKAKWYYEEEKDHPLPEIEKNKDESDEDHSKRVLIEYQKKWIDFVKKIKDDEFVYIIESFLFQDVLFFPHFMNDLDKQVIKEYSHKLLGIAQGLNPVIIHLYQRDVDKSLRGNWQRRGEEWTKWFIERFEKSLYCMNRKIEGEVGNIKLWQDFTDLTLELFEEYNFRKLQIENSSQEWGTYRKQMLEFLDLKFIEEKLFDSSFSRFYGKYLVNGTTAKFYEKDNRQLVDLFWPGIKLIPVSKNVCETEGFPITFKFYSYGGKKKIKLINADCYYEKDSIMNEYKPYRKETENKNIKTFYNKNIPSDMNYKISPKEVFRIDLSDNNPDKAISSITFDNLCVDKEKNIYLVDHKICRINKLDFQGKYVTGFGKKGTGPGEMNMPLNVAIMDNRLYVFDYAERKTDIFDLDGNFKKADSIAPNAFFYFVTVVNDEKFTGIVALDRYELGKVYTVYQVPIYSKKSKPLKELYNREEILQPPNDRFWPSSYQPPYAVGPDKIYVMENSTKKYSILVFNFEGELLYKISKNYVRIKIKDEDLKDTNYEKTEYKEIKVYKNVASVLGIHATKDGYLLVQASIERTPENRFDYIVDAFKDGIYINSFKLDIGKAFDFFNSDHKRWFIGDRIYYYNKEEKCLKVYEY